MTCHPPLPAALALLLPLLPPTPGAASPAASPAALGCWEDDPQGGDAAYAAAAARFGVPEPLLRALVAVESGGRPRPQGPARDGRVGIAGLRAGSTADRAAGLLGLHPGTFAADRAADLLGAAAVLARLAASSPDLETTLAAYAPTDHPAAAAEWVVRVRDLARAAGLDPLTSSLPGWLPSGRDPPPFFPPDAARPDYPEARWVGPACDYTPASRGVGDLEFVVVHTCEGGFSGCWGWLAGCHDVSAHYVVSEAGEVVQVVEDNDIGWHVGCLNGSSIGIEHEGSAHDPSHPDSQYCASARLVRWLCDTYRIPCDRSHVIGHNEANDLYCGRDHWDPGGGWDWGTFMDYVACGCGGCAPRFPRFDLRAEIETIPDRPRDPCTLHGSEGIFDLQAGERTVVGLYLSNRGEAVGRNVVAGIALASDALRVVRWSVLDDWPGHTCGETWCPNDADTHPDNPPHDAPGSAFDLHLNAFSPGETKWIRLEVEAVAGSLADPRPPEIRLWVRHVDDYYEKSAYDAVDFVNTGGYQTFNGGDLRVAARADVLAPERCDGTADDDCDGVTDEDCSPESEPDASPTDAPPDAPPADAAEDGGGDAAWSGGWSDGGGCGCRAPSRGPSPDPLDLVPALLAAAILVRRRRRGPPPGGQAARIA